MATGGRRRRSVEKKTAKGETKWGVFLSVFFFTLMLAEEHGSRRPDTTLGASGAGWGLKAEEKRFAVAVSGLVMERRTRGGSSVCSTGRRAGGADTPFPLSAEVAPPGPRGPAEVFERFLPPDYY